MSTLTHPPRPISDALVTFTDDEGTTWSVDGSSDLRHAYRLRLQADAILRDACTCDTDAVDVSEQHYEQHDLWVTVHRRCQLCQSIGAEPDVMVHGHLETRPDPAAYRGKVRYRLPKVHRAMPHRDRVAWAWQPVTQADGYAWQMDGALYAVTHHAVRIGASRLLIGAPGLAQSTGRRETIIAAGTAAARQRNRTAKRAAKRATIGARVGKPGKAAGPFTYSPRSLPKVWRDASAETHALAALWASLMHTATDDGAPVTIGAVTFTRDGAARVTLDRGARVPMTIGEAARRIALAGILPD